MMMFNAAVGDHNDIAVCILALTPGISTDCCALDLPQLSLKNLQQRQKSNLLTQYMVLGKTFHSRLSYGRSLSASISAFTCLCLSMCCVCLSHRMLAYLCVYCVPVSN